MNWKKTLREINELVYAHFLMPNPYTYSTPLTDKWLGFPPTTNKDMMDGSLMLLNPNVQYGEEWEAWIYANWYLGASRFPSFADLIQDEYAHTIDAMEYK